VTGTGLRTAFTNYRRWMSMNLYHGICEHLVRRNKTSRPSSRCTALLRTKYFSRLVTVRRTHQGLAEFWENRVEYFIVYLQCHDIIDVHKHYYLHTLTTVNWIKQAATTKLDHKIYTNDYNIMCKILNLNMMVVIFV